MKMLRRDVMAMLLVTSLSGVAACGDDDESPQPPADGGAPTGDAGSTPADSAAPPAVDSGVPAQDSGSSDAGQAPVAAACPTHPAVTVQGDFCVLGGPTGAVITQDLVVEPVTGKQWALRGKVVVGEDRGGDAQLNAMRSATLTVRPGVTIQGDNSILSFLVVSRGSKLMAEGTAAAPITFTALGDAKRPSSWGGLVINGRARATCGVACVSEGEGGLFGGPDDADSSGTLKYVRVFWAGFEFTPGNELNGIAFNAVGNTTNVDYVQVHYNGDDGIEMFGGAVNIKHAVLVGNGDDNIDWQLGWRGKLQHAMVIQDPMLGDHGIEADNTEANAEADPISNPVLANVTMIGNTSTSNDGVHLRRGTKGQLHSFAVGNFRRSCVNVTMDTHPRLPADLVMRGSRIGCTTLYLNAPSDTNFFNVAGSNNMTLAAPADLLALFRSTSTTAPDLRLKDGSALLTGGSKVAGDAFFDQVDHIGAFNATDNWAAGWTEFPAPVM